MSWFVFATMMSENTQAGRGPYEFWRIHTSVMVPFELAWPGEWAWVRDGVWVYQCVCVCVCVCVCSRVCEGERVTRRSRM